MILTGLVHFQRFTFLLGLFLFFKQFKDAYFFVCTKGGLRYVQFIQFNKYVYKSMIENEDIIILTNLPDSVGNFHNTFPFLFVLGGSTVLETITVSIGCSTPFR
jgi:hypothetical protein